MLDIASSSRRAHGSDFVHPGGLQWLFRRLGSPTFAVFVADAAFVVIDDGYAIVACAGRGESRRLDLIAAAEERARDMGAKAIEVSVWEDDAALRDALGARGYDWSGTFSHELIYDATAPAAPSLPEGFAFRMLTPADDDAYVAMHRDAWSTHAPSSYTRELHDRVTGMPDFDRALVPAITAPDGTLAAYCIGWVDRRSWTAEIEPLGTRPEYRKRGLAHAVVAEVIRRAYARGARSVLVWGAHQNEEALRLYAASGMTTRRTLREMKRAL